jgi:hypothetical protein
MTDRILYTAWNWVVLGLVAVMGASSLAMIYIALLKLVNKRLDLGVAPLLAGFALAGAAWLLARHREDVIGMLD